METTEFSIRRFALIGRFYMPRLYLQAIFYAVFSLLAGIVLVYSCKNIGTILFFKFTLFAFSVMASLGPLAFTTRSSSVIETTLPATGSEKSAFMLLYCFVVIPLLLLLPFSAVVLIGLDHMTTAAPIMPWVLKFLWNDLQTSAPSHIMYVLVATAVCLLGVCAFRRRRVIRSLLLVFGTYILIGIANLIHGLVILKGLSERGIIGKTVYSVDSNEQLLNDLTEVTRANGDLFGSFSHFGICELAVLILATAILIPAICRRIKNRQI